MPYLYIINYPQLQEYIQIKGMATSNVNAVAYAYILVLVNKMALHEIIIHADNKYVHTSC